MQTQTNPHQTNHLIMEGAEPFFYPGGKTGCLLVHGFTSTPFTMRELGKKLADDGFTVAAPLLAGHGTSPEHLSGMTWQDWIASAEESLAALQAHGCERIYLIGLSLGAAVVLYLASQEPERFAGVVTMSAPVWLPRMLGNALSSASRAVPYFDKKFSDIADPNARARQLTYQKIPLATISTLADLLTHLRSQLPRITAPILIIYARKDHLVHPLNSMHVYSNVSSIDKSMQVLHRGYHIVTVDTDKEIAFASIEQFIKEKEQAASAAASRR